MITNIEITGVGNYKPDDVVKKYINKKINQLYKRLPRHARKSAKVDVKLAQVNKAHGNKYEVHVLLHVPDKVLTAKDSTVNILAAMDIVEAKLVSQLKKYKEDTIPHVGRRKLLDHFKRSYSREN